MPCYCNLCDEDGHPNVTASVYCTSCRLYLCKACLRLHHRFPPIRDHPLINMEIKRNERCFRTEELTTGSDLNLQHEGHNHQEDKHTRHETRTCEIDTVPGKREDESMVSLKLTPIPVEDHTDQCMISAVIGDYPLVLKGETGMFKYGNGLYKVDWLQNAVKARLKDFAEYLEGGGSFGRVNSNKDYGYIIYNIRNKGVTSAELPSVLRSCRVGTICNPPSDIYFQRMRNDIHGLLEDKTLTINKHYRCQLFRYLDNIAIHQQNYCQRTSITGMDPNCLPFPIPDDIKSEPEVLRAWETDDVREREWDDSVDVEYKHDDSGDDEDDKITDEYAHNVFVESLAQRADDNVAQFDLTIDGVVAWREMEVDVIKNDTLLFGYLYQPHFLSQDKKRQKRKQLNNYFSSHYRRIENDIGVENRIELFATNIEAGWKQFENLVEKLQYQ